MRGELKLYQEQVKQHKRDIEHVAEKRETLKGSYFNTMRERGNQAYTQANKAAMDAQLDQMRMPENAREKGGKTEEENKVEGV